MSKAAFLKEKTDAECRELAAHYYRRARKAEAELAAAKIEAASLRANLQRVRGAAYELIETIEAE